MQFVRVHKMGWVSLGLLLAFAACGKRRIEVAASRKKRPPPAEVRPKEVRDTTVRTVATPTHPKHTHPHAHPHEISGHHHHPHPHPHLEGPNGHHHPY